MSQMVATRPRKGSSSGYDPPRSGLLQRQCAGCGKHTGGGSECNTCKQSGSAAGRPAKAAGITDTRDKRQKRQPYNGSATIVCDGSGGYRVDLGSYASATCGTQACVTAHEQSHIADWKAKWPTGCAGKPAGGPVPKGDPPDNPVMTVDEYNSFLEESECKAHTVDLECARAIPATGHCKGAVESYVALTEKQRAQHCKGWPTWLKAGLGGIIGAAVGGLAGAAFGHTGLGAGIGLGAGALVGGLLL